MTQLAVSDQLMEKIASAAQSCGRTPETLLDKIFTDIMETDEAFARRMLTPEVGQRIRADLREVDRGNFTTSEEVDAKFDALFQRLRSK